MDASNSRATATFEYGVLTSVSCKEVEFQRITDLVRRDMEEQAHHGSFFSLPSNFSQQQRRCLGESVGISVPRRTKQAYRRSDDRNVVAVAGASEQLKGIQRLLIEQNRQITQFVDRHNLETIFQQQSLLHDMKLDSLNSSDSAAVRSGMIQHTAMQESFVQTRDTSTLSSSNPEQLPSIPIKWLQKPQAKRSRERMILIGERASVLSTSASGRKKSGLCEVKKREGNIDKAAENMPSAKSVPLGRDSVLSTTHHLSVNRLPAGDVSPGGAVLSQRAAQPQRTKKHASPQRLHYYIVNGKAEKIEDNAKGDTGIAEWKDSALQCITRMQAFVRGNFELY